MWNTDSLWFEVSIVTFFFLLGNIFLGHFNERTPKIQKVIKYFVTLLIILSLSFYFGRLLALAVFTLLLLPVLYIHAYWLPKKGINGWTGEPKSKYYQLRGWKEDNPK